MATRYELYTAYNLVAIVTDRFSSEVVVLILDNIYCEHNYY